MSFVKSTRNPKDQIIFTCYCTSSNSSSGYLDFKKVSVWLWWDMEFLPSGRCQGPQGEWMARLLLHGFLLFSLPMGEVRPWPHAMNNEDPSCHSACAPLESREAWREKSKAVIPHLGRTLESPWNFKPLTCLGPTSRDSDLISLGRAWPLRGLKVSQVILIVSCIEHRLVPSF